MMLLGIVDEAAQVRQLLSQRQLCPLGPHRYDPRCTKCATSSALATAWRPWALISGYMLLQAKFTPAAPLLYELLLEVHLVCCTGYVALFISSFVLPGMLAVSYPPAFLFLLLSNYLNSARVNLDDRVDLYMF